MRSGSEKFADLGSPRRVWAIAAIHGDKDRLMALHDYIAPRFAVRDRLVYLGNYLGVGGRYNDVVFEELLAFRSALLAKPGMEPTDIVHLRGPAEEAWQRLLRLQFAPLPTQTLDSLLEAGVEAYLRLYGININDAKAVARAGSVAITRWTNQLRVVQRMGEGHESLMCSMRRAAFTKPEIKKGSNAQRLLFVPAGFNAARPLEDQGDNLWYSPPSFRTVANGLPTYTRVVRGYDFLRHGVDTDGPAVTLDGGCGFGGPLVCGCFKADGSIKEMVAIGGPSALDTLSFESQSACLTDPEPRTSPSFWDRPLAASA